MASNRPIESKEEENSVGSVDSIPMVLLLPSWSPASNRSRVLLDSIPRSVGEIERVLLILLMQQVFVVEFPEELTLLFELVPLSRRPWKRTRLALLEAARAACCSANDGSEEFMGLAYACMSSSELVENVRQCSQFAMEGRGENKNIQSCSAIPTLTPTSGLQLYRNIFR